ncbi:hypothetical protein HOLleu_34359 [Holothuria leucospilota]|uniref:Uncharacterized protein n=1 Tax=Holothuria leucospilota TaxID=206669 RepID=A0A9Q0YL41_HOLLE|nr:hypothetical protein HOLleu_34359 [Holothuria leucospilota]
MDLAGIGSESESRCSPFRANSDSRTSHSGSLPSPTKSGLKSGIESSDSSDSDVTALSKNLPSQQVSNIYATFSRTLLRVKPI